MPNYVFETFDYPKYYRNAEQKEKEDLLLDMRLKLRAALEPNEEGFVYSFWPDVVTLKEIGDRYGGKFDEEDPVYKAMLEHLAKTREAIARVAMAPSMTCLSRRFFSATMMNGTMSAIESNNTGRYICQWRASGQPS